MLRIDASGVGFLVSQQDYEDLSRFSWYILRATRGRVYAFRKLSPAEVAETGRKTESMHRRILSAPPGFDVDHINGDTKDNRRENLRLASRAQNLWNSRAHKDASCQYKGVYWRKDKRLFVAELMHLGKRYHLGYFRDAEKAKEAYDSKAAELYGDFDFNRRAAVVV